MIDCLEKGNIVNEQTYASELRQIELYHQLEAQKEAKGLWVLAPGRNARSHCSYRRGLNSLLVLSIVY